MPKNEKISNKNLKVAVTSIDFSIRKTSSRATMESRPRTVLRRNQLKQSSNSSNNREVMISFDLHPLI